MSAQRFRAREHLRRPKDFERVYTLRRSASAGPLVAYAAPNGLDWNRLGLSVGKRIGNAVVRNRTKRRLREAYRLSKSVLPMGFDLVIVARSAKLPLLAELVKELPQLIQRAILRCDIAPPLA